MPPFSPRTCASAASRNGIRRPIGRTNLPSRTSSANSRSLDGSGCVRTRAIFTVEFWAAALSGKTAAYPNEPLCLTFAISFAATSPPTVSTIASTKRKFSIALSSSIARTLVTPRERASSSSFPRTPAITCAPIFFAVCTAARQVEDRGKGIPPGKREAMESGGTPGVGIRGMRERLRRLGGSLEINSNGTGTVVVARLPVASTSLIAA
jgi:hypothetical protein